MNTRTILTRLLPLCLALGPVACDDKKPDETKESTKGDDGKAAADTKDTKDTKDAKADEGADAKADEGADAKADEGGDAKADEGGDAKADEGGDAKADEGGDAKGDEGGKAAKGDEGGKAAKGDEGGKKPKGDDGGGDSKVDAKAIFLKKCKSCHGVKGNADTKLGKKHDIPDWTEKGWKGKWPLAKVKDIVTNGESGTKMKPFKEKLSKEEIDAVSKYSRKLGK